MNDLATLTSQPVPLRVAVRDDAGKPTGEILEYQVHPLTFADHGMLQTWINGCHPSPFDNASEAIERARIAGKPFNVSQEQFLLRTASELAMRPRCLIGMPEADALLLSTEGIKQVLIAGIRKGNPSFGAPEAERLFRFMTSADILKAYTATQLNLVTSNPKATPLDVRPPTRPPGGKGSRRRRAAKKA